MTDSIQFVVYCKPEPQGSIRAFMPKGWKRPVLTSTNKQLKSFRQEVAIAASLASAAACKRSAGDPPLPFGKHVPVIMRVWFYLAKPESCPKKRALPVVKPDLSKLVRAAEDALTGIIYHDDAQIVQIEAYKFYELPERVEIEVGKPEAVIG